MKRYNLKINGETYSAYIVSYHDSGAVVEVNGNKFSVEFLEDGSASIPKIERSARELPATPEFENNNDSDGSIYSPIPGVIVKVLAEEGEEVKKGQPIVILEAMKMESEIPAPCNGKIAEILVKEKAPVTEGQLMVKVTPSNKPAPAQKPKPQPKKKAPVQAPVAPAPTPAPSAGGKGVSAPIPGTILGIKVKVGDRVNAGDPVIILEAMKMESEISSEYAGTVTNIRFNTGDAVQEGDVMIELGD